MTAPNMIETVRGLIQDGSLLVRQEVQLAKAEASEKLQSIQFGLIEIVAAAIIALVALLILAMGVVQALANLMPPSFASLLVGIVLAICAFIALKSAQSNFEDLGESRVARSLSDDVDAVRDGISDMSRRTGS